MVLSTPSIPSADRPALLGLTLLGICMSAAIHAVPHDTHHHPAPPLSTAHSLPELAPLSVLGSRAVPAREAGTGYPRLWLST